jgi:ABC-2 type transport system permease protein
VTFPDRYLGLAISIVTGAFCFSALGIMVSTFVPNEDAAPAIINFVLFPLLFISGTFGQVSDTSLIGRVSAVFPVRALNRSMIGVFDPFGGGVGVRVGDVAIIVAWGIVGLAISMRRFRWEPRR